jgi:hypothetical protein
MISIDFKSFQIICILINLTVQFTSNAILEVMFQSDMPPVAFEGRHVFVTIAAEINSCASNRVLQGLMAVFEISRSLSFVLSVFII